MILYVDSDVILLKNPFPYLFSINGYDFIVQRDKGSVCSGFMFIKPSKQSLYLFEEAASYIQDVNVRDQSAINIARRVTKTPTYFLPESLFPSGMEFFKKYQYYWDRKGIINNSNLAFRW